LFLIIKKIKGKRNYTFWRKHELRGRQQGDQAEANLYGRSISKRPLPVLSEILIANGLREPVHDLIQKLEVSFAS